MVMTFLEIQKRIELRARFTIEPDLIKSMTNEKLQFLVGQFNQATFLTTEAFETIDDQLVYDLGDNVRKVSDLRTLEADVTQAATLFAPESPTVIPWREAYNKSQAIAPDTNKLGHIIILKSNQGDRTVAAGNNLNLSFYRHPVKMVANDDIPEFPEMFHPLIVLATVVELHEDKFGSSPFERQYNELNNLYVASLQKEPDADYEDHDIIYRKDFL